jgi:hypothetical protein
MIRVLEFAATFFAGGVSSLLALSYVARRKLRAMLRP